MPPARRRTRSKDRRSGAARPAPPPAVPPPGRGLGIPLALTLALLLVSIVILGGLATIWGSLLGAMVFVLLEEGMRFLPFLPPEHSGQARQIVLGILLVWLMLFRPQGLVGRYKL